MPVIIPGPVDASGNITVPEIGGATIFLNEQTNATPPVQLDLSTYPLLFVVKGRLSIVPGVNPSDPLGRLLTITDDDADQIPAKPVRFALLDMTTPLNPLPLWEGTIRRGS